MNRKLGGSQSEFDKRWKALFCVDSTTAAGCWTRLDVAVDDPDMNCAQPCHLIFASLSLKKGTSLADFSKDFGCDEGTFDMWSQIFVHRMPFLANDVLSTSRFAVVVDAVAPASHYKACSFSLVSQIAWEN